MTPEQKSINRLRFRVAAFFYLAALGVMAFILAWLGKDVSGFALVSGTLATPMSALLVADYATNPK